ncbi:hypothetical protein PTI98_003936 [Pleurotus ostreatus]|nr:hypothetical protein PTI98_003936 [Pleurotus ostreatus]
MPQPYIHSFAHIPTVRSTFPPGTSSDSHTRQSGGGHGHGHGDVDGGVDVVGHGGNDGDDGHGALPQEFDFIVVGGGPSGCALATRLYARTQGRASVLLVEAGMHPAESPELNNCVPRILQTRALHRSAFDYAYPTHHEHEREHEDDHEREHGHEHGHEHERHHEHGNTEDTEDNKDGEGGAAQGTEHGANPNPKPKPKQLVLNSGKVLGGSTCINFGIWTKGAKADYDLWAALVGCDEFSWAGMGACFDRAVSPSLPNPTPPHPTPTNPPTPTPTHPAPAPTPTPPIKTRRISQSPRLHRWSGVARRALEERGFRVLDSAVDRVYGVDDGVNGGLGVNGVNGGLGELGGSDTGARVGGGVGGEGGGREGVADVFGELTECVDAAQARSTALGYFEAIVDPLLLPQTREADTASASASSPLIPAGAIPAPATPATPTTPTRARAKFEVWTSLRVERVVFEDDVDGEEGKKKKAVGVQTRFGVVRARREVSPYILLQSGIGPAPHLAARGVPLVRDSPGVGRNLWEHPFVDVRAKLRPAHRKDTVETFASLVTSAPHLHQWATERSGLMSGLPYEWLAYSNMHAELSSLFTPPHPSSRPSPPPLQPSAPPSTLIPPTPTDTHVLLRSNAPHIEHLIHYGHGLAPAPDATASSYIAVSTVLLVPRSRGYVEIPPTSTSTSTLTLRGAEGPAAETPQKPRIVVNQLKDPVDRCVLRAAVRRAYAILGAPAWRAYLEEVGEKGDAELDEVVRQRVTTPVLGDGVVDTRFRVEGVEGLRVAGTSSPPLPFPTRMLPISPHFLISSFPRLPYMLILCIIS